jgi:hypothetical protein
MAKKKAMPSRWAPVAGNWSFEGKTAKYLSPEEQRSPFGLALSTDRFRQGTLQARVRLDEPVNGSARIVFGYDSSSTNYFSAGIGGYGRAYVLDEFVQGRGWTGLAHQGSIGNIQAAQDIDLRIELLGQRVRLTVDDVAVLERSLPHPLLSDQTGLFAWGPNLHYS